MCVGLDGVPFAATDPAYLAVNFSDRSYVKDALSGYANTGSPALNKVTKKPFAPFAAPIRSGDRIVGVFALNVDIGFLGDIISNEKIGTSGYAFIIDKTGLMLAHPRVENVFTVNISELEGMTEIAKRMTSGQSGVQTFAFQGAARTGGSAPVKTTGWSVGLSLPDVEFLAPAHDVRDLILLFSGATVLLTFFGQAAMVSGKDSLSS
jgi:methyl-accepting chemotaxis protein